MPSTLRSYTRVVAWCVLIGLLASIPASFAQYTATARPLTDGPWLFVV
jgi:hypothetical protein